MRAFFEIFKDYEVIASTLPFPAESFEEYREGVRENLPAAFSLAEKMGAFCRPVWMSC